MTLVHIHLLLRPNHSSSFPLHVAFDGALLVVPVACVDGEAPSDLACRQAYGLEEDGGEGCGGSGVALGRRWAGLRLLMSLAMRESSGAVFAR